MSTFFFAALHSRCRHKWGTGDIETKHTSHWKLRGSIRFSKDNITLGNFFMQFYSSPFIRTSRIWESTIPFKLISMHLVPHQKIHFSSFLLTPFALNPSICREGMPGHMCSEHAAVWWSVTTRDCGDVRRSLLLSQGLQWCVTDPAGRFPNVPGLRLPLRSYAQVQLQTLFLPLISS